MTDRRSELVSQLESARAQMIAHLDEIDKNRKIYPLWTIREILAHIIGWDDAIIASLQAHIDGRVPATPASRGIDIYNAETVATREGLDYDHIYREYTQTRKELVKLVSAMPAEKTEQPFVMPWGDPGNVNVLLQIFIDHEIEHANDVRKLIDDATRA